MMAQVICLIKVFYSNLMIFRYLFFLLITFGTCSAQTKEINISKFKINGADDIDDTQQFDEAIAYIAEKGGTLTIPAGRYILDNNNRKRIGVNNASYIFLAKNSFIIKMHPNACLLYTSPSPRDVEESRMPSSA